VWDSTPEAADVSGSLGVQVLEDDIETTWVSKDGTSISTATSSPVTFGTLRASPFLGDNDDPDDEEDNYTGNEGGQVLTYDVRGCLGHAM
jgi:hypothetical protein